MTKLRKSPHYCGLRGRMSSRPIEMPIAEPPSLRARIASVHPPAAMKLTVENLGRIRSAELDIRPLTVFAGENGTNKTWTAYCLYTLLEKLSFGKRWIEGEMQLDPALESRIGEKAAALWSSVDRAAPRFESRHEIRRRDLLQLGEHSTLTFSVSSPVIQRAVAAPVSEGSAARIELPLKDFSSVPVFTLQLAITESSCLTEYFGESEDIESPLSSILRGVMGPGLQNIERALTELSLARFRNVTCLPAERKLLAQIYPLVSADVKLATRLPKPLFDFAMMMSGGSWSDSPLGNHPEARLWEARLSHVAGGTYVRDSDSATGLLFRPRGGAAMPLQGSSSFVKSIAGLAVYLRASGPGGVLFIDEPEMNAHPRAQAALLELLATLVNQGNQVVLTTHSPYFVDHLTNLIEGSTLSPEGQDEIAKKLYLKDKSAFLQPADVAVHVFEETGSEVTVRSAFDRESRSIDWTTFSAVSDDVSNLLSEILAMKRGAEG